MPCRPWAACGLTPRIVLRVALTLTHVLAWAPVALLLLNGASFRVYSRTRRLMLPHAITPTKARDTRIDV